MHYMHILRIYGSWYSGGCFLHAAEDYTYV